MTYISMEMDDEEVMDDPMKRPRKLDFNARLLSVRRPPELSQIELQDVSAMDSSHYRVPFSWEEAAGRPKDIHNISRLITQDNTLPPPRKWHRRVQAIDHIDYDYHLDDNHSDNDDNNDNPDDDFSDAMERFSLSDMSIDMVEPADDEKRRYSGSGVQSPNFIFRRFLPAANALAFPRHFTKQRPSRNETCTSRAVARTSDASEKSCGAQGLFSWRMKQHRLCGVKNPVMQEPHKPKTPRIVREN